MLRSCAVNLAIKTALVTVESYRWKLGRLRMGRI